MTLLTMSCTLLSDSTNQLFDVMFESANRVVCDFHSQQGNQILGRKSCIIAYGPCDEILSSTTVQGVSDSSTNVVIDLQEQPLINGYCYMVTASNGTTTVKIQGEYRCMEQLKLIY